jgi:hypothetical protein
MGYDFKKLGDTAKKVSTYLASKGVKVAVKTSRYQTEIKAVEVASPTSLEDLLKSVGLKGTISDLSTTEEKAISGKYKAKLIKITASSGPCSTGETFFIVNTFTEKGTLKTKDLAPEKFNLTSGRFKSLDTFDTAVLKGIKDNKTVPNDIKTTIAELYKSVAANKSSNKDNIPMNTAAKKSFAVVKPQDKQAIGKDFGEILSMRWYVTQAFASTWQECFFSEISNEALVDFVVTKKVGSKVIPSNISAKFEAGAAPSIGAIVDNLDVVYKNPNAAEKAAIDVLKALADSNSNTSTKILAAMKTIKHPAYDVLKKIIGKPTFTIADISAHIQKIATKNKTAKGRIDEFMKIYKPFYDKLGKNASPDSIAVVFAGASYKKYYSLVMAPSGYALVDYMNKQPIYQTILNNISQQMKTEQVYLNFVGETMQFTKKLFSKASFKFAYGANAKDSDNTGIKFSML